MLEGWNEGASKGGKIVGGPGDVPSSIKENPHPRPSGDVGIGRSAVGKHSVSQLQSSLMKLIDCTRRGHVRSKSGSRHRRVCTCGDEAARKITAKDICVFALPQNQLRPVLWPLKLRSRCKGLETGTRTIGSVVDGIETYDAADAKNPEIAAGGRAQEDAAGGKTVGEFSGREASAISAVGQNDRVYVLWGQREVGRAKTRARRGVGVVRVIRHG